MGHDGGRTAQRQRQNYGGQDEQFESQHLLYSGKLKFFHTNLLFRRNVGRAAPEYGWRHIDDCDGGTRKRWDLL